MPKITVSDSDAGSRLDSFLATNNTQGLNRSNIQKLINTSKVLVNDEPCADKNYRLRVHDSISFSLPRKPKKREFPVVYEDRKVIVIDKPQGVLTHSKGGVEAEYTVGDFVLSKVNNNIQRQGIVHRLDRNTSGVLIAAKDDETRDYLMKQFSDRSVQKLYVAVVSGNVEEDNFRIDMPIARNPKKPHTFTTSAKGKEAITDIKRIIAKPQYSVLLVAPKTGRTHQIRVHLAQIGHPILGDDLYSHEAGTLMLHSYQLSLKAPDSERSTFNANLPGNMKQYIGDETVIKEISRFNKDTA